jgi:hypothetical protein
VEQVRVGKAASANATSPWLTQRLGEQIRWYGRAARRSRWGYLTTRLLTLLAAAAITVISITGWAPDGWTPTWLPGILGAGIALLEGVQGLFHWRDQWFIYRATAEALKREQSLYEAQAGPYAETTPNKALALLAVRAEQVMSAESTSWRQLQDRTDGRPTATQGRQAATSSGEGPTPASEP